MVKKTVHKHTLVINLESYMDRMFASTKFALDKTNGHHTIMDESGVYFEVDLDELKTLTDLLTFSWEQGIGWCLQHNENGETNSELWRDSSTKDYMELHMVIKKYRQDEKRRLHKTRR
jgi:hypothetical protein